MAKAKARITTIDDGMPLDQDLDFIVHAPQDIADLVAEVERLQGK